MTAPSATPPGPRMTVIGAGRLGAALAASLRNAGQPFDHTPRSQVEPWVDRLPTAPEGRVWVFAVRDREIAAVAARCAPAMRPGDTLVHLAGMLGPEALGEVARAVGAASVSAHPLAAVSSPRDQALAPGSAFLLEGDDAAVTEIAKQLQHLGYVTFTAEGVRRPAYHAAAALVATGAVALAQGAQTLFRAALGEAATEPFVRAATSSLLRSVALNLCLDGPAAALASPLLRDDTSTVEAHLAVGDALAPRAAAMYRAALLQVLDGLAVERRVSEATVARAREVIAR